MHLECPHCQASYDIDSDISDAACVCHRCGQEFAAQPQPDTTEPPLLLAMPDQPASACVDEHEIAAELPPLRKTVHLWPWFLTMLVLLVVGGFWVQKDAWMDNRWLRSTLINIGVELPMRAKDWRIVPDSVQPKWINRNDGSRVLFIRGRIDNLMRSDMYLPRINIVFFSKIAPQKQIGQTVAIIRHTPSEQQLRQTPIILPAIDSALVPTLGKHDFAVVVESVPQETGDFSLMPALP